MQKRILVYGDSNTWGLRAFQGRYDFDEQWVNILQKKLGDKYIVIQEGLCGRIAGNHDPIDVHRNGKVSFEVALRTACPVDLLIVALGTNDLKDKYHLSPEDIFNDLLWYKYRTIHYAKEDEDMTNKKPIVMFVNTPNYISGEYFHVPQEKRALLNDMLNASGEITIDLGKLELSKDGVHYSKADHKVVADVIFKKIKELKI